MSEKCVLHAKKMGAKPMQKMPHLLPQKTIPIFVKIISKKKKIISNLF